MKRGEGKKGKRVADKSRFLRSSKRSITSDHKKKESISVKARGISRYHFCAVNFMYGPSIFICSLSVRECMCTVESVCAMPRKTLQEHDGNIFFFSFLYSPIIFFILCFYSIYELAIFLNTKTGCVGFWIGYIYFTIVKVKKFINSVCGRVNVLEIAR